MKKRFVLLALCIVTSGAIAQESLVYQKPSQEILELVNVPLAPSVLFDDQKQYMALLYRDAYKTIDELSQKELRLGGLRIDPATNIGSRVTYQHRLAVFKPVDYISHICTGTCAGEPGGLCCLQVEHPDFHSF